MKKSTVPSICRSVLLAALSATAGCAHHSILPKHYEDLEKHLSKPTSKHLSSDASWRLDCISFESQKYDILPMRVMVGKVINKMSGSTDLPLPSDISDYIKTSVGRVTAVFALHEAADTTGLTPIANDVLLTPATEINERYEISARAQPQVVITGALTHAERLKVAEYEGDFFGLSTGAIAEVSVISVYLAAIDPNSRGSLANPRHMIATTFTLTKGGSLLVIKGDNFVRGRLNVEVNSPTVVALQLLADSLVADLAAELLQWNYPAANLKHCENPLDANPERYFSNDGSTVETNGISASIHKPQDKNLVCIHIDFEQDWPPSTHKYSVVLDAYRSMTYRAYSASTTISVDELLERDSFLCIADYYPAPDHQLVVRIFNSEDQLVLTKSQAFSELLQ